jgi:ArsR family transcriptional regulator
MKTTSQLFKALSEPIRLRILALLTSGERCVCDLMAALNLPQSTISRHLSFLRNGGLVTGRRGGQWMYYQLSIDDNPLSQQISKWLRDELVALPQSQEDQQALTAYLATKDKKACGRKAPGHQ